MMNNDRTAYPTAPPLAISLPIWKGRPAAEALEVATNAGECGCEEIWVGETNAYDAFALAMAVAERVADATVIVGPLAAAVRSPATIAMGVAALSELGGRPAGVAIGASSPTIVRGWHGSEVGPPLAAVAESAACVRALLAGERSALSGRALNSNGFHLRQAVPGASVEIAAFGPRMLKLAAECGDGLVLNMVSPEQVLALGRGAGLLPRDDAAAPRIAVWVQVAAEPAAADLARFKEDMAIYIGAPGYADRFRELGFDAVVDVAQNGGRLNQIAAAIPDELLESSGAVGSVATVRDRIGAYHAAGADTVVVQPVTYGDPGGRRALAAALGRERVRS